MPDVAKLQKKVLQRAEPRDPGGRSSHEKGAKTRCWSNYSEGLGGMLRRKIFTFGYSELAEHASKTATRYEICQILLITNDPHF